MGIIRAYYRVKFPFNRLTSLYTMMSSNIRKHWIFFDHTPQLNFYWKAHKIKISIQRKGEVLSNFHWMVTHKPHFIHRLKEIQRHCNKRKEWLTLLNRPFSRYIWVEIIEFIASLLSLCQIYRSQRWKRSREVEDSGISSLAPYKGIQQIFAVESGVQLEESGIPLTIRIRNPSSSNKGSGIQYLESGIDGVETVLDSRTLGHLVKWRNRAIVLSSGFSVLPTG